MFTGLVQTTAQQDVNLSNVWFTALSAPGTDNLPTWVRFYFTLTDYVEITGEDARNYARARAAFLPALADTPRESA